MKKLFTLIMILVLSLASVLSVYADEMVLKSVDTVLTEIRAELSLKTTDTIDPDKVSQTRLEELGDSVMEAMLGNSALHEQMDINMGGEGSESLTAMHIRIGYSYLSNLQKGMTGLNNSFGWGHMMGNNDRNSMTGYHGWGMTRGFNVNGMMGFQNRSGKTITQNMTGKTLTQNWNDRAENSCFNKNIVTPNPTNQSTVPGWNTMMNSNDGNYNWNGMMD